MRAIREREAIKELEEELLVYKKQVMEQHQKGFHKAVRQVGFFVKDLDLSLFDSFKDMKDGDLLDEEEIAAEEDVVDKEQSAEQQGDDAHVQATFVFIFLFFFIVGILVVQAF